MWFDTTFVIVECVPGRYLTFKSISGISPCLIYYQYEPVENLGTNVIVIQTINFTAGFLGFAEQVIKDAIRRQATNDLLTLKDILETTAST
jgi:hypothetical protein